MLVRKETIVGIDGYIDRLQSDIYVLLKKKWGIDNDVAYDCFPRCYRNQSANGYIAEMYTGKNEYKEVYYNDKVAATSFFGIGQAATFAADNIETSDIHLVFMTNVSILRPGTERNDEQVRIDVQSALDSIGSARGFSLKRQVLGIDKILEEYPGSRKDGGLKIIADTHPVHSFRFDLQLYYQPTQKLCSL